MPLPADFNRGLASAGFESLLRAAEAGCLRAQFLVGLSYHTGRGVPTDYQLAGDWYRKAAGSGDTHAIANLGVMSLLGQGAPRDEVEAYTWIQSAVGLGHEWLRPALEALEQHITASSACPLPSVSPEVPVLARCTRAECDQSRCELS